MARYLDQIVTQNASTPGCGRDTAPQPSPCDPFLAAACGARLAQFHLFCLEPNAYNPAAAGPRAPTEVVQLLSPDELIA